MGRRELGRASLAAVQAGGRTEPAGYALLIACSGGADSLALAFAARYVATRRDLPYAAAVIDHGLQHDSADVAARVEISLPRLATTT